MLYRSRQIIKSSKLNLFATAMKERVQLYSTLYVACKSRQADLADFFRHENHDYPPALSDYGNLRKPTAKSDVLKCLINPSDEANEAPLADAYVIDGAAFVHMNPPKLSTNYGDYCEHELGWKVKSLAKSVKRIDVVFDIYKQQSR